MALNEERPKWLFPKLSSANELSRISSTNLEEKKFQTTGSMAMRLIIDNQRNGLETHAKVDSTSVIRFVWNPVTSL
jgi:hypothetical protein